MKNSKANVPEINYFTEGRGAPAILIHGMAGSCQSWSYQIPALLEAGYQVFALDLPGHGDSPKPVERSQYHIDVIYDELITWMASLGLDQPALLVGHSMGGYLSFRYALDNPASVRGMVLIDPFYGLEQLYPLIRISARRPRLSATVYQRAPNWAMRTFVTLLKKYTVNVPHKVLRQMLADLTKASHRILYTTPTAQNLLPSLPSIQTKAVVIWGDRDLTLAPNTFPGIVSALPNASGVEIRNAGHTPHLSNPGAFNEAMRLFLNELSKPVIGGPEWEPMEKSTNNRPRRPVRTSKNKGVTA